ncbi:hypothetical protein [Burkholderia sp. WSM2232]|uniref:hypothetical protein n=1 Tax=Burkholderia sp. WSM2232 TaxID=944436 RepID=UPI00040D8FF1|nr:hypothetical protein [Burkholderia sp. WSM2232]
MQATGRTPAESEAAAPAGMPPPVAARQNVPEESAPARTTTATMPGPTPLSKMRERATSQQAANSSPPTSALNSQIVQAVQLTNAETASYAASQVATPPDMMISQASGLVAQSAASYFDGVSKLALASQAVLLKKMTENLAEQKLAAAAEDALGALATDLLMGAAAAVAAAAGAIEAESASFAIDKIDQSIARYSATLANRKAS